MGRIRGRWAAGIVAGGVLVPIVIVVDIHRRSAGTLDRYARETEAEGARLKREPATRPVVLGEPEQGNAWDLYYEAFAGLQRITSDKCEVIPTLSSTLDEEDIPDDQQIGEILASFDPELRLLRRATCRSEVDPPGLPDDNLAYSIRAMKVLSAATDRYHRIGNDAEAMDLVLVALAMAQDLSRRRPLHGIAYHSLGESIACSSAQETLSDFDLDARQLESIAGRIDGLIRRRPTVVDALPLERVWARRLLLSVGRGEADLGRSPSWRQLWSKSVMAAQALPSVDRYFETAKGLDSRSPYERIGLASSLTSERFAGRNPAATAVLGSLKGIVRRDATSLMELLLLRISVGLAWYEAERGTAPEALRDLVPRYLPAVPSCPLSGKPFGYSFRRVWSVGRDGTDDGGALDPQLGYDPDTESMDVVWFVKRK